MIPQTYMTEQNLNSTYAVGWSQMSMLLEGQALDWFEQPLEIAMLSIQRIILALVSLR